MSIRVNSSVTLQPASGGSAHYDGTTPLAATGNTLPVNVSAVDAYSVQVSLPASSTLAGSFTLQASNDLGAQQSDGVSNAALVSNWVTISAWDQTAGAQAASVTIASGAANAMLAERGCVYRWLRLAFTFTSGTGNPTIILQQKGC